MLLLNTAARGGWFTKSVLGHLLKYMRNHEIRHMPDRHLPENMLGNMPGNVPRYMLKHVPARHM